MRTTALQDVFLEGAAASAPLFERRLPATATLQKSGFKGCTNLSSVEECLDILQALLIHGMVVQGDHRFDHYGPVSIGRPDRRSLDCCEAHAKNLAALTKKLFP